MIQILDDHFNIPSLNNINENINNIFYQRFQML